jgi:hypothetical protein
MKYIFAGNFIEYTQYVNNQIENGFLEIRTIEQINKLNAGDTLLITENHNKKSIWPEIEKIAKNKGIIIEKI